MLDLRERSLDIFGGKKGVTSLGGDCGDTSAPAVSKR